MATRARLVVSSALRASFSAERMPVFRFSVAEVLLAALVTLAALSAGVVLTSAACGARDASRDSARARHPRTRLLRGPTCRRATTSGRRSRRANRASHRLAQPDDHRAALRDRRGDRARRPHAVRPLSRLRARRPRRRPRLRPNVEAVLGARPDLVVLYASDDNRAGARAACSRRASPRSASRSTASRSSSATRDSSAALTGADPRARAARRHRSARRSTRVRAATPALPRPTRVHAHVGSPDHRHRRRQLHDRAARRSPARATCTPTSRRRRRTVTLEDVVAAQSRLRALAGGFGAATFAPSARWRAVPAVRAGHVLVYDTRSSAARRSSLGAAARSLAELLHPGVVR